TFDDGPSKLTPKILDILDKYNAKATFFVTGFATDCSKYIKEAHDRGHTIGMHTYTHDYSNVYKSTEAYYKDLNKISKLCEKELGFTPQYIRFPGGSSNTVSSNYCDGIMTYLSKDVLKKGYQYYDWNCANGDAVGGEQSAEKLYKNAIESIGGTDLVMLCHDSGDKQSTVDSLPKIIEYYQAHGYELKAIDDTSYVPHHCINN
ncbi:MAG: polysaccharide deacetylase, partial [Ruminococcus sp.]|nr:polysaccharide deacetylase [Ruminococcus sp.]